MRIKVWVVGIRDVESNTILHVCSSKEKALERWDKIRKEIIEQTEDNLKYHKSKSDIPDHYIEMLERCISNLQVTDPLKMDNFPHDEPFMHEMELE